MQYSSHQHTWNSFLECKNAAHYKHSSPLDTRCCSSTETFVWIGPLPVINKGRARCCRASGSVWGLDGGQAALNTVNLTVCHRIQFTSCWFKLAQQTVLFAPGQAGCFLEAFCPAVNKRSDGKETVMVDYGCDNGRLFCVLFTRVENLSSPRGRKTNEGKINSQFTILQSLVLLCDLLTEGSVLSACGSGSQSRGSRMPTTPATLSHPIPLTCAHKHTHSLTKVF